MTTQHKKILTTQEVAARFNELAQQEKWFEIQDEFFAENAVRSERWSDCIRAILLLRKLSMPHWTDITPSFQ